MFKKVIFPGMRFLDKLPFPIISRLLKFFIEFGLMLGLIKER